MAASSSLTAAQEAAWSQSRQPAILGVVITMLILGNISVPMRFWAQWRIHKRILLEDYCLVVALVFANIVSAALLVAWYNGFGLHTWRVEMEDRTMGHLRNILLSFWITAVFNGPSLFATKLALLFYYRRLFVIYQRWIRIAWWSNLIYVSLWVVGSTTFYIFQCLPANYYWERVDPSSTITHGACPHSTNIIGVPLILNILSDVTILLLPVITVSTLQMRMARKLGLAAVFSVGAAASASAIARVLVLEIGTDVQSDATYNTAPFEVLCVVELNLAIVCTCAVPIASCLRMARAKRPRQTDGYEMYGKSSQTGRSATKTHLSTIAAHDNAALGRSMSTEQLHYSTATTSVETKEEGRWESDSADAHQIMVKVDVDVR
ncbi:uncharacterized protein BP01DRAFT_343296 [Aspergillus saccharolyticus JOP 1030-1]|uniref:Rhodopsin domain-containing protein n=1 Tax=Aspergillus saccharolyticus JOP 1030-1 TaxID=1450539 RepID=A0A318ZHK0_9EURO|nr:hypothetical protein BP01DRAFT_343296 [Aspergillus saccharolyticus JOP 1030-1]PYH44043.1 hypothetical protein BP01DRAFT_343296 [Aspergillus saccharolyticus JOP 1030-1]